MIRILSDSACGILPEEAARLQLDVVPLRVVFEDGEALRDGIDILPDEFFKRLPGEAKLPTTSLPPISDFVERFEAAKAAGDTVVAIMVSSELSGTYQAARLAAAEADFDDAIFVDTRNVTIGQELLVRLALSLRDSGCTAAEIAETLEKQKERVRVLAVVDTLKYLHKGGRLSGAAAVVGGALGIRPVVTVQDGKVAMAGKARGLPGAFVALFKLIDEQGGLDGSLPYTIAYTDRRGLCEPITRYVTHNLGLEEKLYSQIGPVIGTHVGPGAVGIAFFAKE